MHRSTALPPRPAVRRALTTACGVALLGVAACATEAVSSPEPVVRVIVRFRPDVVDPVEPASLVALARRADVDGIDLLRPMSGDSYVLTMRCGAAHAAVEADPCAAALSRLAAVDTVLSAEIDGRVRHR